jgi:prefoldin subunit 5
VITIDGVLEVLGTVAERYEKIVEQTVNYVYSVEELTARVRQLADLMSRLDKRIAAIVRTLRSLRRKYKLDDQKIESLVGSYLAFRPPRNIGDYFEALANNPQHPLLKDSRFIGVQNAHKKMLRLQSELARYQDVQSEYLAAEDRIAALLGLKDLIELLSNDIGKLAGLKRGRRRLTVTLEWLDKALGILNKAGDLISSIGKYLPSS